jgi:hypothetical protein
MTADRDLIQQYLDQLRLSLLIPEVGRILVEAEDHLRDAAAAGVAAGLTETEAQRAAIAAFGPVPAIVYAHQTRHGRVAAMLADVALALWRVVIGYLLVIFVLGLTGFLGPLGAAGTLACTIRAPCTMLLREPTTTAAAVISLTAPGGVGLALLAAYLLVRRAQRRRGRVWSVPLGGYFPLTTVIVSAGVAVGALVLNNIHVVTGRLGVGLAVIGLLAVGLVVTYGGRMWQMLRQQARGRGELA